jgi:hypothetical protein
MYRQKREDQETRVVWQGTVIVGQEHTGAAASIEHMGLLT